MSIDACFVNPMIDEPECFSRQTAVGHFANRPAESRLQMVVLAAGASRRLGQPKQLVMLGGEPLLRRQCHLR